MVKNGWNYSLGIVFFIFFCIVGVVGRFWLTSLLNDG